MMKTILCKIWKTCFRKKKSALRAAWRKKKCFEKNKIGASRRWIVSKVMMKTILWCGAPVPLPPELCAVPRFSGLLKISPRPRLLVLCAVEARPRWARGCLCRRAPAWMGSGLLRRRASAWMGSWSCVPPSPGLDGLLDVCAAEPRPGWAFGLLRRRASAWMGSWSCVPSSPGPDGP